MCVHRNSIPTQPNPNLSQCRSIYLPTNGVCTHTRGEERTEGERGARAPVWFVVGLPARIAVLGNVESLKIILKVDESWLDW